MNKLSGNMVWFMIELPVVWETSMKIHIKMDQNIISLPPVIRNLWNQEKQQATLLVLFDPDPLLVLLHLLFVTEGRTPIRPLSHESSAPNLLL